MIRTHESQSRSSRQRSLRPCIMGCQRWISVWLAVAAFTLVAEPVKAQSQTARLQPFKAGALTRVHLRSRVQPRFCCTVRQSGRAKAACCSPDFGCCCGSRGLLFTGTGQFLARSTSFELLKSSQGHRPAARGKWCICLCNFPWVLAGSASLLALQPADSPFTKQHIRRPRRRRSGESPSICMTVRL